MHSRLFIGTFFDCENLFDVIDTSKIFEPVKDILEPVAKNNIHLTWKFLGNVEQDKIKSLKEELIEVKSLKPQIKLKFDSIGIWPKSKKPKVLVLKGDKFPEELFDIYRKINISLKKLELVNDTKSFIPHITIARFRHKASINSEYKKNISEISYEKEITINSFSLVESIISDKPAVYKELKVYKF